MRVSPILTAAALATVALPAVAEAGTLLPLKACYVSANEGSREPVYLEGNGYTPNATVTINLDGTDVGTATIDAAGNLPRGFVRAPFLSRGEKTFTITVTEQGAPAPAATVTSKVTALSVSVSPKRARPTSRVTWRGRGFTGAGPVYQHYVKGKKRRTTRRLAVPTGDCGTFEVKAKQFPFRPGRGLWTLQMDQQRAYSAQPNGVFVRLLFQVTRTVR